MSIATKNKVATVLVVEDDDPTRQLLCDHLEADQFDTTPAPSGETARILLGAHQFDMVLLDLTLPEGGLELLKEIRSSELNGQAGVIVISSRGTERDRIWGLGDGADDYIQKPFSYGELVARIGAVLRRTRKDDPVTTVGEITINNRTDEVTVAGRKVRLTGKELALLKVMAKEPSRVFSHSELLQEVWGYRSMGHTRTLEAHCNRLSRKLDPDKGRYVLNCWGVGRRLTWPDQND